MKAILFVNDNEVLSRLSCEILQMEGYRATPAYNAAQALEIFDKEDFDIVVTDARIQETSGLDLARALHAKTPHLPVIVVTTHGTLELGSDVQDCVAKDEGLFPKLLDKISMCLAKADRQLVGEEVPD
ncbi:MAG: response regulator [Terriglobales bacterium]